MAVVPADAPAREHSGDGQPGGAHRVGEVELGASSRPSNRSGSLAQDDRVDVGEAPSPHRQGARSTASRTDRADRDLHAAWPVLALADADHRQRRAHVCPPSPAASGRRGSAGAPVRWWRGRARVRGAAGSRIRRAASPTRISPVAVAGRPASGAARTGSSSAFSTPSSATSSGSWWRDSVVQLRDVHLGRGETEPGPRRARPRGGPSPSGSGRSRPGSRVSIRWSRPRTHAGRPARRRAVSPAASTTTAAASPTGARRAPASGEATSAPPAARPRSGWPDVCAAGSPGRAARQRVTTSAICRSPVSPASMPWRRPAARRWRRGAAAAGASRYGSSCSGHHLVGGSAAERPRPTP